ncbi:MAG: hypothetical protein OEW39_17020 [Deltaproteobacteria bacterium]|nr:hypothetical protein [Deltaproteobacteria bacterium]
MNLFTRLLLGLGLWVSALLGLSPLGLSSLHAAEAVYKPFVLGSHQEGAPEAVAAAAKKALQGAGLEVVGEYGPYPGTHLLIVSSPELRRLASQSENGAFGAVQRVAVVADGTKVQVSYTNPFYMQHAYRMKGDLGPVAKQLEAALGKLQEFGIETALSAKALGKYHYMISRPYFEDVDALAEYPDQATALAAVEAGLAAKKGGVSKVFRVDIEGKPETLFGVSLTQKSSGDAFVMKEIDFKPLKSAAHLPYEMLVVKGKVIALPADYRIAINFPELSMMGANSFMNIMSAPGDTHDALSAAAKNK